MPKKSRQALRHRAGYCLFCNAAATSHEHLWSDWMRKFFPNGFKYSENLAQRGRSNFAETGPVKQSDGGPWTKTFKAVCGTCNHGWMSEIEEGVKPLLMNLALGRNISLALGDQQDLTRWIALKMMVSEFCDLGRNRTEVFNTQDYHGIRNDNWNIPPGFKAWIIRSAEIACWGAQYMRVSRSLGRTGLDEPASSRCNAAVGMWGIGELLIVWARAPFEDRKYTFEPSPFTGCQLWPVMYEKINWPPVVHFTGQDHLASAIQSRKWDLEHCDQAAEEAAALIDSPDWMPEYSITSTTDKFVVGTPAIYFIPPLI